MTNGERVRAAINHQQPDRVPIDFGGTGVTGMHISCVGQLRNYFGLPKQPVKLIEPYQMLGEIDDELREIVGIDTIPLNSEKTLFGFKNENWREFKTPWGQEVLVPENFKVKKEPNGDLLIFPEGDTTVAPSGRMPSGGYFFDTIIRQEPIDETNLNPEDNLEEFGLISEKTLQFFAGQIPALKKSNRAVIGGIGGTGFGDIAFVPAPFLKHPKGIRDITEWYISTAIRRDFIHKIFSYQCELALQNLEKFRQVIGQVLDVFFVCGTDFGTQTSSFCSTETFDELYAPYYKKVNNWIHKNTTWKTFKHSCGSVEKFILHFIDSGFDVINPVQCSAAGMEPRLLKKKYGDNIVFWGAGVDTQQTLPFGSPEQVRRQVLERCEIFSSQGGFIFNTVHNIQARTPVENMVAMFEAVNEFNGAK